MQKQENCTKIKNKQNESFAVSKCLYKKVSQNVLKMDETNINFLQKLLKI